MEPGLAAEIAAFIEAQGLSAGAHLRTAELAARFGVSRWPVEQALKALAGMGRVTHEPNRGYFVAVGEGGRGADGSAAPLADPVLDAYFRLAAMLVGGAIGLQVSEQELRERLGLTRRQTADLMARFAREGLAEKRAGYGWNFLPEFSRPGALAQTYQLRMMLEPASLRLPGYRLDPAEIARLRQVEESLLGGDIDRLAPDALYARATGFHEALIAGAGNPFLLQALVRVNRVRRLLIYPSMQDRARYYGQSREHIAILDRIAAGEMEAAAALMEAHLGHVMSSMRALGLMGGDVPDDTSGLPGQGRIGPRPYA